MFDPTRPTTDAESLESLEKRGVTHQSGGVSSVQISGDVVVRDKIFRITTNITDAQQYDVRSLANPYLGLQSFTYADHAKYSGREKLIKETVARLRILNNPVNNTYEVSYP